MGSTSGNDNDRAFLSITTSRPVLGPTQPPNQWASAVLSLGVKRLGREDDYPLPFSAEVMKAWSYTSTPQYVDIARCLIKQEIHLHGAVLN